jgi:Ni2+-binding GTPase involved in maturation of urease and hydrogenase
VKFVTCCGPPSVGKTSVLVKTIASLRAADIRVGVAKFDCLSTNDDQRYAAVGVPVYKALSGTLCPDHFFVSNLDDIFAWAELHKLDWLITESAGLCNRCSPYLKDVLAVCVIDHLSGVHAPLKIGPMLRLADIVVTTKGDVVSQAEREVFRLQATRVNPSAAILNVSGLTGQGAAELASMLCQRVGDDVDLSNATLRFTMPAALCSYCLGEMRVGENYQIGNVRKL